MRSTDYLTVIGIILCEWVIVIVIATGIVGVIIIIFTLKVNDIHQIIMTTSTDTTTVSVIIYHIAILIVIIVQMSSGRRVINIDYYTRGLLRELMQEIVVVAVTGAIC